MPRKPDLDQPSDFLVLLVPYATANFGVVAAPEEPEFLRGECREIPRSRLIQDGGNGTSLVFVSPAKCEKVTDPEVVEAYRAIIYGGRQSTPTVATQS